MTFLAYYGAFCLACTAAFLALVAQAARRDRKAAQVPAQRRPAYDETDYLRAYLTVHKIALECAGQQLADEAEEYANRGQR